MTSRNIINTSPASASETERTIIVTPNSQISFASIIEKAKAEQRTEAPHQNEGDAQ